MILPALLLLARLALCNTTPYQSDCPISKAWDQLRVELHNLGDGIVDSLPETPSCTKGNTTSFAYALTVSLSMRPDAVYKMTSVKLTRTSVMF